MKIQRKEKWASYILALYIFEYNEIIISSLSHKTKDKQDLVQMLHENLNALHETISILMFSELK